MVNSLVIVLLPYVLLQTKDAEAISISRSNKKISLSIFY